MHTSESLKALRRANPRSRENFERSVEAAAYVVRARLGAGVAVERSANVPVPRRRVVGVSLAGSALACAAAVVALLTLGLPGGGPAVESAAAAVKKAATVTAASAEHSGVAVVRVSHNGELWSGSTIRWNGEDLAVTQDSPDRHGRTGSMSLLVDGSMYVFEKGEWVNIGSPESIDPDSGTTPAETLAAVREDVGGATLRRITEGMTGLTTSERDDGSTVYSGAVAAGLVARESGFKEGQAIRVFPFGYVAHDEAANPDALLDAAVTVGAEGIVREITVTWGTWVYSVAYSGLGETPAPVAPENARDLLRERLAAD